MSELFITPAGLVYLYPWHFSPKPRFGGFKPPCGEGKVKHDVLAQSAITATYIYLDNTRLAQLTLKKKGLIFKHDAVVATKTSPHAGRQGYLTRRLASLKVGESEEVFKLVADNVEVASPPRYLLNKILEYDIKPSPIAIAGKIDCNKVAHLRPQAEALRNLVVHYRETRPKLYKALWEDSKRILASMQIEEEEDYDYD